MDEREIRELIVKQRDAWRRMRADIKRRPKPWSPEIASKYEQYDLVAVVLNELLELIEWGPDDSDGDGDAR